MTSSIARMNLFLHGIEDFEIVRGDTLASPAFTRGRPPGPSTWSSPIRRTPSSSGTATRGQPTPGAATSWHPAAGPRRLRVLPAHPRQHGPATGRCAILFPHGVLFRRRRAEMRAEARRGGRRRVRARPRTRTSSTTRRWRPASSSAGRKKPPERAGQGPVHRCGGRGHPRARAELPEGRAHQQRIGKPTTAFADEPRASQGRATLRRDCSTGTQPLNPALREARRIEHVARSDSGSLVRRGG